jgi:hypothetical protein
MSKSLIILNIKSDMPTVEEARKRLLVELRRARAQGARAIKLIHGYGSTGVGGKLRDALRSSLSRRRKEGLIQFFVIGEKWSIFEEQGRAALEACPELRGDSDLDRGNEGVTIIVLPQP